MRTASRDLRPRCGLCGEIVRDGERMVEQVWAGDGGGREVLVAAVAHYRCFEAWGAEYVGAGPVRSSRRFSC